MRLVLALCALALLCTAPVLAQDKKKAADDKKKTVAEQPKIPEAEDHMLETEDGVELHYTYYPSFEGKKGVPIVLIHGWESRRTELDPLAKFLQQQGHAVMVPDLRGHGASNTRKLPQRPAETLTPANLKPGDLAQMATTDFLLLKRDLLTRHNAGEFNIELLTLVGMDVGSVLALNWAALDWSQPDLPTIRLGHDVKAIVLISPVQSYKQLNQNAALRNQNVVRRLSVMLAAGGNDSKANTELKRLENLIGKFHPAPKPETGESDEDFAKRRRQKQDFYVFSEDTTLQGAKLLTAKSLNVPAKIAGFIKFRLVDPAEAKDLPAWEGERRTKETLPQ